MKIRQGFVSNSSSSSYYITDYKCPEYIIFAHHAERNEDIEITETRVLDSNDNATHSLCRDLDIDIDKFLECYHHHG